MRSLISCVTAAIAVSSFAAVDSANAALAYGVTTQNILFSFDTSSPTNLISAVSVTGLQSNENVLAIDFRPSDLNGDAINDVNTLYGVGSASRLYRINTTTGAASVVGGAFSTVVNGTEFGFDFNPTIDRIRLVSDTDRNWVLNPDTGAIQLIATPLNYNVTDVNAGANPSVIASAYTNSFPGSTSSQLYGIDSVLNTLVRQGNNNGVLDTVGPLGVDANSLVAFDIGPGNIAYALISRTPNEATELYTINLASGATSLVGQVDGGLYARALAVSIPEPTTLVALAGFALVTLRRKGA